MTIFGISLHIIIALIFAIHAIRSGRELYWLLILFFFPLLGSIVYFFAVFLPELRSGTRAQYHLRKVAKLTVSSLDPGRELREAKAAFEYTPTAKNQWRYANALLEADQLAEAVAQFEQCLQGPASNDLEIQFAAANAQFKFQQPEKALNLLLAIRKSSVSFRVEAVTLLLAQTYAQLGNNDAAKTEFEQAIMRFGSVEARVEYAIWATRQGDIGTARHICVELEDLKKYWSKSVRAQYSPLMKKLESVMQNLKN